ncbi:heavy metal translocatin [Cryphonectria parasitica EP155]|uniref:Heavy metal translocatin n=1 Tax=Cryphonectria parasitica (strain ATCC 38755 / EP155) TaxID=660469 RepID=A0A9P5CJX8_CRYP1|nr:heavy metal translocatin [Cryphonectria parasitica EP155]KAF3761463.1 heavy metal translocatin [Cryphonectria parasitica EP155]
MPSSLSKRAPGSSSGGRGGRHPPQQSGASVVVKTSYSVSNLHCPTCVTAIRHELMEAFGDKVLWVSPNIVTSVVTVEHDSSVKIKKMADVLTDAGYEVSGVSTSADDSEDASSQINNATAASLHDGQATETRPAPYKTLSTWLSGDHSQSEAARVHLLNCEQCRNSQGTSTKPCHDQPHGGAASPPASSSSAGAQHPEGAAAQKPNDMSLVTVDSDDSSSADKQLWRASLAVGGMTCAACINNIKGTLDELDWVTESAVNLLSNSATVEFYGKGHADDIVEAIEDSGYEAHLDSVEPVESEQAETQERTVEILLGGIYCSHCPGRVISSLAGFRRQIDIITEPTQAKPIMKIAYVPEAPNFTIRHILAAVEAGDPALQVSIYHPPSLEERSKMAQHQHQRRLLYRAIFTFIVAIPTFILGVVYMSLIPDPNTSKDFLTRPWVSGISRAQIAMFILATPVYFFAADVFHTRALKEIKTLWRRGSQMPILRRFYRFGSMNTLMSLGTTIAYVSSVAQLIAAGVNKPDHVNDQEFYFDSVVFLTLFLLVGRWIEAYSKSKTGDAVTALGKLRPTEAVLVERKDEGKTEDKVVKADLLDFGDTVRIRHGASPPADGIVVEGETSFDESSLTGEARLIKKGPEDAVYAGTVNKDKPVVIRITGVAGTSMLDQIVKVVREGQTKRAPMEQIADVLTTYFVPVVTLIAIVTWLIWMILGLSGVIPNDYLDVTSGGWVAFSLQFAIAVFVVACPCGLGLAAPTAIFVGGGLAAKHGILAKGGGEAFEKASRIDCVVFDKTGTLTEGGLPSITDSTIFPDPGAFSKEQTSTMLAALKAVEESSSHPIAKAIVSFCAERELDPNVDTTDVQEEPGKGLKATFSSGETHEMLVGNEAMMKDHGVELSEKVVSMTDTWKKEAKSIALVAMRCTSSSEPHFKIAAALAISDPIRPESVDIVQSLQSRGTRVWMLSGDNEVTARAVATLIGIPSDQVISGVLPTQKADKIKYLQSTLKARRGSDKNKEGEEASTRATVAMVGDGINDSPALTQADVGIAIGSGSDVAISSAEFVLVKSDLWSVVTLLDLSQAVFTRVKVNFAWALVYNMVAVPIAAGVLMPIVSNGSHVRLDPVWASLAMALSSISVVTSSLALRSGIPGLGFREKSHGRKDKRERGNGSEGVPSDKARL